MSLRLINSHHFDSFNSTLPGSSVYTLVCSSDVASTFSPATHVQSPPSTSARQQHLAAAADHGQRDQGRAHLQARAQHVCNRQHQRERAQAALPALPAHAARQHVYHLHDRRTLLQHRAADADTQLHPRRRPCDGVIPPSTPAPAPPWMSATTPTSQEKYPQTSTADIPRGGYGKPSHRHKPLSNTNHQHQHSGSTLPQTTRSLTRHRQCAVANRQATPRQYQPCGHICARPNPAGLRVADHLCCAPSPGHQRGHRQPPCHLQQRRADDPRPDLSCTCRQPMSTPARAIPMCLPDVLAALILRVQSDCARLQPSCQPSLTGRPTGTLRPRLDPLQGYALISATATPASSTSPAPSATTSSTTGPPRHCPTPTQAPTMWGPPTRHRPCCGTGLVADRAHLQPGHDGAPLDRRVTSHRHSTSLHHRQRPASQHSNPAARPFAHPALSTSRC